MNLQELNKLLKGAASIVSPSIFYEKSEPFSTGIPALDKITGIGGLPKGRIIELFGQESSGKSSLAMQIVGNAQKQGLRCFWADAENSFLIDYAEKLGVDTKTLNIIRAEYAENYFRTFEELIKGKLADVIVLDSVTTAVPRAEMEADIENAIIADKARFLSRVLSRLNSLLREGGAFGTTVILINQTRTGMDMFRRRSFEYATGGKAIPFYASLRLKTIYLGKFLKQGEEIVGRRVQIYVEKSKVARAYGKADFDFRFDEGFSVVASLLDHAISLGKLEKRGNTLWFGNEKLGTLNKAREFLEKNPAVKQAIEKEME